MISGVVEPTLDHLVYGTPNLEATVAWFTAATGVAPAPGGRHLGRGTRNNLVASGRRRTWRSSVRTPSTPPTQA